MLLIRRLIGYARYGVSGPDGGLLDRENDVSQIDHECLLFGFVPISMGYYKPLVIEEGSTEPVYEYIFRNYATGRMSIADLRGVALVEELQEQKDRFSVVIYKDSDDAGASILAQTEEHLWVRKQRVVEHSPEALSTEFEIDMTLNDIRNDLIRISSIQRESSAHDHLEFIIIDRLPGLKHTIFEEVGLMLGELAGRSVHLERCGG
ncbi:hypothetical protein LTR66_017828 [Elasticomyces elasticus]|nr:hypothetical protein LTR66_017828 [Elasticomyces elasticus]